MRPVSNFLIMQLSNSRIGKQNCFPGQIDHLQYQNTTAGNYAQLLLFLFTLPLGLLAGISFLCYSPIFDS